MISNLDLASLSTGSGLMAYGHRRWNMQPPWNALEVFYAYRASKGIVVGEDSQVQGAGFPRCRLAAPTDISFVRLAHSRNLSFVGIGNDDYACSMIALLRRSSRTMNDTAHLRKL